MVKNIDDKDFEKEIRQGKVLVDCYADWCGPCRMIAPIIEELSNEIDDYKFYKMNVDTNMETSKKYGIMSIPTLLIFEDGKLIKQEIGLKSKKELKDLLK